ncbi:hypothetical protein D0Y65_051028 [Glycine soja]|uniref:RNase H type-1 domain-containing protein n=2 Tax=Glycine soja TaxID=3848 RepID=A0A445FEJ6_GLYSO|nr:hypothetical protein D0Y65_051028 [Glycine soja]
MCSTSSLGNTNFEANGECTKGKGTNKQGNHSTLGPTCETMHDPVTNMGPKSMLILKANKDQLAYANAYTNHYRAPMSGPTKTHNVKNRLDRCMANPAWRLLFSHGLVEFVFYKTYWEIIAMEMCNLVRSAFTTGTFPPQLVETLVVPMPKVDNPTSMKEQKASEGYWKPIKVSDGGPEISHLFFVDDYLLFTKASCSQVRLVKEVLDAFHKAFGLKVWGVGRVFSSHETTTWTSQTSGGLRILVYMVSRNKEALKSKEWTLWYTVNQIKKTQAIITTHTTTTPASTSSMREITWSLPSTNAIKLNLDGSSLGNPGPSGYGVLLQNSQGEWLQGFKGFWGHATNLYAKFIALLKGVQLAWDRGDRHVICKSNSLTALDILHQDDTMLHPYASIINQLKEFKTRNWTTSFVHTLRERN